MIIAIQHHMGHKITSIEFRCAIPNPFTNRCSFTLVLLMCSVTINDFFLLNTVKGKSFPQFIKSCSWRAVTRIH